MGFLVPLRFCCGMDWSADLGGNWRDAEAYRGLLEADRSLFAWEWLRRHRAYRNAAGGRLAKFGASATAKDFGLVRFEPPDAAVPFARPLWCKEIYPQVLLAEQSFDGAGRSGFALDRIRHLAQLVHGGATDHLLLSDGLRTIRLDGPRGVFEGSRFSLRLEVDLLISGDLSLLQLRRFLALVRSGDFSRSLHSAEPRARRLILQLRAHDALAAGADLREIAEQLLGRSSAGRGWRMRDPSLRSQAQRLVRSAKILADGGFCQLLRRPISLDQQCITTRPIKRAMLAMSVVKTDEPCLFHSRPWKRQGSKSGRMPRRADP